MLNFLAAYIGSYRTTVDGFNAQFQVNYASHFLLTLLLLPSLIRGGKEGQNSRIVNVTSITCLMGNINFDDFIMK